MKTLRIRQVGVTVFTIGFLCCTVSGCALPSVESYVPPPPGLSDVSQYKTVAFISLLPKTISLSYTGLTIFGNHSAVDDLDWDPNTLMDQTAVSLLSKTYQVKDIGVDRTTIATDVQQKYAYLNLGNTAGLVEAELKAHVKPGSVDLIIVVDGSAPIGSEHPGPGLISTGHIGAPGNVVRVIAPMEVFDGTTFQELAETFKGQLSHANGTLDWQGGPYGDIDDTQQQILEHYEHLVVQNYPARALLGLGLINASNCTPPNTAYCPDLTN